MIYKKRFIVMVLGIACLVGCGSHTSAANVNDQPTNIVSESNVPQVTDADIEALSIREVEAVQVSKQVVGAGGQVIQASRQEVKGDEKAVKDCFAKKVLMLYNHPTARYSAVTADLDGDKQLELLVIYQESEQESEFKIQVYEYGNKEAILAAELKGGLGSNSDGGKTYNLVKDKKGHYYLQELCAGDGWEYTEYIDYNKSRLSEKAYYSRRSNFNRDTLEVGKSFINYKFEGKDTSESKYTAFTKELSEEIKLTDFYALKTVLLDNTKSGKAILEAAGMDFSAAETVANDSSAGKKITKNKQGETVINDQAIKEILFNGLGIRMIKGELGPVTKGEYGENRVAGYALTLYEEASGEVKAFSVEKGCEIFGLHLTETPNEVRKLLGKPKYESMIEETGRYTQFYNKGAYDLVIEYDEQKSMIRILVKDANMQY